MKLGIVGAGAIGKKQAEAAKESRYENPLDHRS